MDKIVKKLRDKSLSGEDIMKLVDNKANLITYPELAEYKNIDECLKPHGAAVILVETKENYGHWICIFKQNNKVLEYFDPYGLKVDEALKFIPNNFRIKNNEKFPHLSYLLLNSKYVLTYNHYKLQKFMKDVNTCGRHVAFRLILRNIDLDTYIKLLTKNNSYDPDFWVSALTLFI